MMKKPVMLIASIILIIVGIVVAYLSIFHDAFGGASGFMAVLGVSVTLLLVCSLFGISGSDIDRYTSNHIDSLEIEKLNNEWNNAQRKYDRYNPKRK